MSHTTRPLPPLQPLLDEATVVLAAPTQVWSAADGSMDEPIHGVYHSDSRIFRGLGLTVDGLEPESISTATSDATSVTFTSLVRNIDDTAADPRVRLDRRRTVASGRIGEQLRFSSALGEAVTAEVRLTIVADFAPIQSVKAGVAGVGLGLRSAVHDLDLEPVTIGSSVEGPTVRVTAGTSSAVVHAPDAALAVEERSDGSVAVTLCWRIEIPARGECVIRWDADVADSAAVVGGAPGEAEWTGATVDSGDSRLARWSARALDDLAALRMTTAARPGDTFLAAGAPWFFTLFGRDSIWAARFLLPLGTGIAASTLRVLAGLQGAESVDETAEQPGKIMHELRPGTLEIPGENVSLPPLYFGTVDATALWITLLVDAWRWGLPDEEVQALLPHLRRALDWMRDHGDSDGDGFLEYADITGHGLANQGWKDSGDSVQWRDGRLAEGPIALCEVQAYAYEAARGGADLLDHFGEPGAQEWRTWADDLAERFRAAFWIEREASDGRTVRYPAIALDAQKHPVDTLTSNIGHLLGTGILNAEESAIVAALLVSPELDSGFGLRTMSTDSAGFWPLSYHGGSVWAHDTAIAVHGLARDGFRAEAAELSRGLLAAAESFDYRMPELHSGDSARFTARPAPYPAACRPQAWSAAASIVVTAAALDLRPTGDRTGVTVARLADASLGHIRIEGVRVGSSLFRVQATPEGASADRA